MFLVDEHIIPDIREHSKENSPNESCGLILIKKGRQVYFPCKNSHPLPQESFEISPDDIVSAEDGGDVVAIVHSHVGTPPVPSDADKVQMEKHGLPWVIVNYPVGNIGVYEPSGYEPPLEGRQFCHGVLDCYSLVRDFYKAEFGVVLQDYPRNPYWWDNGENLYMDQYESGGWVPVDPSNIRRGDMILMQHNSNVPNHAGVYLGDDIMLHHMMGRLSTKEVYGGYWKKITRLVLRQGSML